MILDTILITLVIFELFVIIDLWTDLKKAKAPKKVVEVIVVERPNLDNAKELMEKFKNAPFYVDYKNQWRTGYMPVEMTEVKVTE